MNLWMSLVIIFAICARCIFGGSPCSAVHNFMSPLSSGTHFQLSSTAQFNSIADMQEQIRIILMDSNISAMDQAILFSLVNATDEGVLCIISYYQSNAN
ncbi:unnamed protein product [Chironomus riparius]|uniref:Uncharacterized protein n=1 Tax=Chironomus riparius TaxID=315576 RepID=A0A9N9WZK0_9DIPT|nr:unnamed protein product [Chironomus riparius]